MEEVNKQTIDISDFIDIPVLFIEYLGFRLFKFQRKDRSIKEKLIYVFILIITVSQFLSQFGVIFFIKGLSIIEYTEYATYMVFTTNAICKLIGVWFGRDILSDVILEMEKIFPKTAQQVREYRLRECHKKTVLFMRTLAFYQCTTVTMFNIYPITVSTYDYIFHGGNFNFAIPYLFVYPFDPEQPMVYPFTYSAQAIFANILACYGLCGDLLLFSTVQLVCMHFDYLANSIRNFIPSGMDEDVNKLNDLIRYHTNILRLSRKINEAFNFAIFTNYLASCVIICMMGFQMTVGTAVLRSSKFFCLMVSYMIHAYLICYSGTNLLEKSDAIADAVFYHQWHLGNAKYRKIMPLLILRAQNTVYLKGFKFFIVSMEHFKNLVTTSYQFFTLIRAKYNDV